MAFWVAALGMTGATLFVLLAMLMRRGDAAQPLASPSKDLEVYRDQLREVERDLARGLIEPGEAERLRTEVSRRVLEADRVLVADQASEGPRQDAQAPFGLTLLAAGLMGIVLLAAIWTYQKIGAPGYPDLPMTARIAQSEALRTSRPVQAVAEADMAARVPAMLAPPDPAYARLMAALRTKLADRPDDLQGQSLLAQNEAGLGNYAAAARAQGRVVAIKGDKVAAQDQAALADLLILAAGGYVSPEAEQALTAALRRDPQNPTARYYTGLLFAQIGRPDLAFRLWRPLLEESGPADPWVPPIRAQLQDIAALAGVEYTLPPDTALKGPSAGDVAAAADMAPEARMQMIRGMVEGLSVRLADTGGSPEEWARLIGAYGVLGEAENAKAALDAARAAFAQDPAALKLVSDAAQQAGLTP